MSDCRCNTGCGGILSGLFGGGCGGGFGSGGLEWIIIIFVVILIFCPNILGGSCNECNDCCDCCD